MERIKKMFVGVVIVAIVAVVVLFLGAVLYEITAPRLTEEKAEKLILKQIHPQIEQIRKEYDIPDLIVDLQFTEFEYTPPKLYDDGKFMCSASLKCKFIDFYKSSEFNELDTVKSIETKFHKYNKIPEIEYTSLGNMRYSIYASRDRDEGGSKHRFLTENNNIYEFSDMTGKTILKNGKEEYNYSKITSDSLTEKCQTCNGTGKVKYYYGESDLEALIDGHEASWYGNCGSCGGKGKIYK